MLYKIDQIDMAILNYLSTLKGWPSTYAEIGAAVGMTKSAAHYRCHKRLFKLGLLNSEPGVNRSITITRKGLSLVQKNPAVDPAPNIKRIGNQENGQS